MCKEIQNVQQQQQQPKQQQQQQTKPKLLMPDCPLQILYINKMLSIKSINNHSAKRQRERNKQKEIENKMQIEKMFKENLTQCKLLCSVNNDDIQQKKNTNSVEANANPLNQIKKLVPNVPSDNKSQTIIICYTPTIAAIRAATDLSALTCLWLKPNITKIHKFFVFNSNEKQHNDQNINNVQDKLVHTSTKKSEDFKINSGKTSTRFNSSITTTTATTATTYLATDVGAISRQHRINWREGVTARLCLIMLLLLVLPLQIMLVNGQQTILLKNQQNNLQYHIQHHMTDLSEQKNLKSMINSIAISNNDEKSILYEKINTPTTLKLTPVSVTTGHMIDQRIAETLKQPTSWHIPKIQLQQQQQQQMERPKNVNQLIENVISKTHKASTNSMYDFKPNHMRLNSTDVIVVAAGESIDNISTLYKKHDHVIHESLITTQPKIKESINDARSDSQKLLKLVKNGLGLQQLPDIRKANISQLEYANKYKEYIQRMHERKRRKLETTHESLRSKIPDYLIEAPLQFVTLTPNNSLTEQYQIRRKRDISNRLRRRARSWRNNLNPKNNILLHFPMNVDVSKIHADDIEEANLRFFLIHNAAVTHCGKRNCNRKSSKSTPKAGKEQRIIHLKVYELLSHDKRKLLDELKIEVEFDRSKSDQTYSQWLQFDVTEAVEKWLQSPMDNLGLQIQCVKCDSLGARILNDASGTSNSEQIAEQEELQYMPVLNIIGKTDGKKHKLNPHHPHYHHTAQERATVGKTDCHKENQRCCRHHMKVVFKEFEDLKFILRPTDIDAGYCRGRCPHLYHAANQHAYLQSLISKQDSSKAPRTCCAPSQLEDLEVMHLDENDPTKLKFSIWTDTRVIECACT